LAEKQVCNFSYHSSPCWLAVWYRLERRSGHRWLRFASGVAREFRHFLLHRLLHRLLDRGAAHDPLTGLPIGAASSGTSRSAWRRRSAKADLEAGHAGSRPFQTLQRPLRPQGR